MSLSLGEAQAVADLAEAFYSFLPGKPHPYGNKQLSFPAVAADLGIGHHWPGGSKQPAITQLLTAALEKEKGRFSPLVIGIVRKGIVYRKAKEPPVTREEIERINGIIARIGYKIPDLHDPAFLDTLPRASSKAEATKAMPDGKSVVELQRQLMSLQSLEPQPRGYAFEAFLSRLFEQFGLAPRSSFRLRGEQLDGSFRLHAEVYLLEARWRNEQAALADLLTFSGKVEGKAQWSRGLFVSYSGFTADGLAAFAQGRRTNIIAMDGLDLWHVVSGNLDLVEVLDRKARRAAETNQAFVPVRELYSTVS